MHYRNGREAKNGDRVIQLDWEGRVVSNGILYGATAGNDYCNGSIAPISHKDACLVDCIHVDDLLEILKAAGLDKRPEGK